MTVSVEVNEACDMHPTEKRHMNTALVAALCCTWARAQCLSQGMAALVVHGMSRMAPDMSMQVGAPAIVEGRRKTPSQRKRLLNMGLAISGVLGANMRFGRGLVN